MKEPDFRCYHVLLDQQLMLEQPQDWRNTPSQQMASTRKNLPLETTTTLVVPASGEPCTTKAQYPSNYPLVQFFEVRYCNHRCLAIEISIGASL